MKYFKIGPYLAASALGMLALAAPAAHAATPSCGVTCIAPYVQSWGTQDVVDSYRQGQATGTPVILFRESDSDPAEDWTYANEASVDGFEAAGLVSKAVALEYGGDEAYELEYSPFGAPTGECMGISGVAVSGSKVSLQPCGVTAATVWIDDTQDGDGGNVPAINGTATEFSDPLVLTYTGTPDVLPRATLFLHQLSKFSSSTTFDDQLWNAQTGVLP